jgi:hypothetical protein
VNLFRRLFPKFEWVMGPDRTRPARDPADFKGERLEVCVYGQIRRLKTGEIHNFARRMTVSEADHFHPILAEKYRRAADWKDTFWESTDKRDSGHMPNELPT